jgi:erythromycin esterase
MTHKPSCVSPLLALGGLLLTLPWHLSAQDPVRLSLIQPWQGHVEMDEARHLEVELQAGEFVRAVVEMDGGREDVVGFQIQLLAPGDSLPRPLSSMEAFLSHTPSPFRRRISWEATRDGSYTLILDGFYVWSQTVSGVPVRVWIESVESPAEVRERRNALAQDPRVAWLRENAMPVRTLSPEDLDFGDLEPLREALEGVRLVLLGEADHTSGTDMLARSRLVKFLHQELGFDVLAFEAGLYGMTVAWDSILAGVPPGRAFRIGNWSFWSSTEQMQPLMAYVGEQALGERPLEVTGFDYRPWLYPSSRETAPLFAEDLSRFLRDQGLPGPLADPETPEYGVLERHAAQAPRSPPDRAATTAFLADSATAEAFLRAVDETVAALQATPGDGARFWAEALRGAGCAARNDGGLGERRDPECSRDYQMGEHLLWLANERYPDRKIIAWAATGHVMREPALHTSGGPVPAVGKVVWDALGQESFAIAMTSYRGGESAGGIVSDQHPLPEFEELMHAAGFEFAMVDLRRAAEQGTWVGGPFLARPNGHLTEERTWSDYLDALFFVREQEAPRRIPNP